ncbi:hypothetical protein M231_01378 [Tremella mesenterica]|uniref:Trafficking protein particle complex subunit n=1 Tax=Tremella mesenterica TaxID=5217 RepID=A0A4Q1BTB2_TREME|nr:hypothetical protein M231_01378 [Tremella mesenterica]
MTIYSLYIYDRHCDCVYYQDWHRTSPIRPPPFTNFRPGVHRIPSPPSITTKESIFNTKRLSALEDVERVGNRELKGLPFDEESKLVYGVILSLRNMVKKLSGRDEAFTSYRTAQYKLHLYETLTGYRFVLLSDPNVDSLRFVLKQIYTGPFLDYVVRNPLVIMDSREEGIDNDLFRSAVDRHMRNLSMFS